MGVSGDKVGGATVNDLPTLSPEPSTKYKIYLCKRWHTDEGLIKYFWDEAWADTCDTLAEAEERVRNLTHTPPERVQIWEVVTQFRRAQCNS